MSRYTHKDLQNDITGINLRLAKVSNGLYLAVQSRNGYSAVDLYEIRVGVVHDVCLRTVGTGSPRECLTAAKDFLLSQYEVYINTVHILGYKVKND